MKIDTLLFLQVVVVVITMILLNTGCSKVGFGNKGDSGSTSSQSASSTDGGALPPGGTIGNENVPDRGSFPVDPLNPGKCTATLNQVTKPVKLMFVVDQSGSNAENNLTAAVGDGTDPNKVFRAGSLQGFLDRFKAKTNFSWGLITFQDLKDGNPLAKSLINSGGNTQTPKFSSNPADMTSAISQFMGVQDNGYTPYKAAITLAQKAITTDPDLNATNETYVVVFITDGMPTDYVKCVTNAAGQTTIEGTGACPGQIAAVDDDALISSVKALANTSNITFNTVYYGANDANKANSIYRLQNMAAAGHGQFVDASGVSTIKIEDSIQVPGVTCP